jgi:hypothetical protein
LELAAIVGTLVGVASSELAWLSPEPQATNKTNRLTNINGTTGRNRLISGGVGFMIFSSSIGAQKHRFFGQLSAWVCGPVHGRSSPHRARNRSNE